MKFSIFTAEKNLMYIAWATFVIFIASLAMLIVTMKELSSLMGKQALFWQENVSVIWRIDSISETGQFF